MNIANDPKMRRKLPGGIGPPPEAAIQLVTFFLGGEEYGLGITRVREIIVTVPATRLPGAGRHVVGIINLRGEVIPVFDMRRWFGLGDTGIPSSSTIISDWRAERFGFTVDAVHQVVWLSVSAIDPPTDHFQERSPYIRGLGKYQNRLLILLDIDALLGDVEGGKGMGGGNK